MKRIFILGSALILLMSFSLWIGCSDDDENSTGTTLAQGDTLDPTYLTFRDGLEGVDLFTNTMLNIVFQVTDSVLHDPSNPNAKVLSIPTAVGLEADSVFLTYHSASGYWYLYEGFYDPRDSAIIVDTVQFLHGTTPVQWPDSALLTGIKSGLSMLWKIEGDLTTSSHEISLVGDFPNSGMVTANGTQQASYAYHDSHVEVADNDTLGCDFDMTFNTTFTGVEFPLGDLEDICPPSGSVVHLATVDVDCSNESDTVTYAGGWKVTLTFAGSTSTWVIENATTRWAGTDDCGGSVVGRIIWPDPQLIFEKARF